jgi:hypothetical protein
MPFPERFLLTRLHYYGRVAYDKPAGTSAPSDGFFGASNNFNISIFIPQFYADDRKSIVIFILEPKPCNVLRRSKCLDCVQV